MRDLPGLLFLLVQKNISLSPSPPAGRRGHDDGPVGAGDHRGDEHPELCVGDPVAGPHAALGQPLPDRSHGPVLLPPLINPLHPHDECEWKYKNTRKHKYT